MKLSTKKKILQGLQIAGGVIMLGALITSIAFPFTLPAALPIAALIKTSFYAGLIGSGVASAGFGVMMVAVKVEENLVIRGNLIDAAARGDIEHLKVCLNDGQDVNMIDDNGNTALIKAAENGCKEIVSLLIEHNADRLIQNNQHKTAYDVAILEAKQFFDDEKRLQHVTNFDVPAAGFLQASAPPANILLATPPANLLQASAPISIVIATPPSLIELSRVSQLQIEGEGEIKQIEGLPEAALSTPGKNPVVVRPSTPVAVSALSMFNVNDLPSVPKKALPNHQTQQQESKRRQISMQ